MRYDVLETVQFIDSNEELRNWYKLLLEENVLSGKECNFWFREYGVVGIMGLRIVVYERQQDKVKLEDLERAKDKEELRLRLQRLFLEPITEEQMDIIDKVIHINEWTMKDIYEEHNRNPLNRILRIIGCSNKHIKK